MREKLFRYRKPSANIVSGMIAATRPARVLLLIVCLAILAAGCSEKDSDTAGQNPLRKVSFNTPEKAITFYLQAMAQGDVSKILQASAVDEMSEKFDFDFYVNRLKMLPFQAPSPSNYPFYAELNNAQFTWQILNQARYLAYGFLTTEEELLEGYPVYDMDPERITGFIEEVNPEKLAQLEVKKMGIPSPDVASDERNLEIWNRHAQTYGADEYTERVVLVSFEGEYYYMGFGLLRYGDNWKIYNASSILGNTPALGTPQKTTEAEFEALISGD